MALYSLLMDNSFCGLFLLLLIIAELTCSEAQSSSDLLPPDLQTGVEPSEYCEGEDFVASCEADEVIVMTMAHYGRMRPGKCISDQGVTGCSSDVMILFDLWCSGQHNCEVKVSSIIDSIPDNKQPCNKNFRSYLEASYICVKAISPSQDDCITNKRVEVTAPAGYLASVVTDETTCGSLDAPWILKMGPGQTIDIELYDFALATRTDETFKNDIPEVCHVYAIIKEKGGKSSETVCGSNIRKSPAYRSLTNILEIRLVTKRKATEDGYFMLKYTARGCSDPVVPPYGWVQRQGDEALLGCNATSDTWTLACQDDVWAGSGFNCTHLTSGGAREKAIIGIFTGSQWASIIIILAIAVTLGLVIFLVGLVIIRRKRGQQQRRAAVFRDHPPTMPDLYSPQYRDSMSTPYNTKHLSAIDCSNSENDYYRTWQLQRHPPGGRMVPTGAHGSYTSTHQDDAMERAHQGGMMCTNPRCLQRPYDTMNSDRPHPVEHIYESPKFDRRDIIPPPPPATQHQTSNSTTGSSTQYFELDPDQV